MSEQKPSGGKTSGRPIIEDYEEFLEEAGRSHRKLAGAIAEAFEEGSKQVRQKLGLPDPKADRIGARLPGPSDVFLEVARLHLDYVNQLADLTKEHGADAHRFLERIFHATGAGPRPIPRLEADFFTSLPGDNPKLEPKVRDLKFIVVNEWKTSGNVSVTTKPFIDIETGAQVAHIPDAECSPSSAVVLGEQVKVTIRLQLQDKGFKLFHAYRTPITVSINGEVCKTIDLIVRILPKDALPVLVFRGRPDDPSGQVSPKERWFPVINDAPIDEEGTRPQAKVESDGVKLQSLTDGSDLDLAVHVFVETPVLDGACATRVQVTLAGGALLPAGQYEGELAVRLHYPVSGKRVPAVRMRVRLEVGEVR